VVSANIVGPNLVVTMSGLDIIWAMRKSLTVPLAHVVEAKVDQVAGKPGWKMWGTGIPGGFSAGKFRSQGKSEFWVAHQKQAALVIILRDEPYARFVLQVENPQATAEMINAAAGGGARSGVTAGEVGSSTLMDADRTPPPATKGAG
jgi:hypothetical protein